MRRNYISILIVMFVYVFLVSGCFVKIREIENDVVLPQIDPEEGVTRQVQGSLYYSLVDREDVVRINSTIYVKSYESVENAVLRILSQTPKEHSDLVVSDLPKGTQAISSQREGSILYLTLSKEFLDKAKLESRRQEIEEEKDRLRPGEYESILNALDKEYFKSMRLSVYSIVNSMLSVSDVDRIQLLVDKNGTGEGVRPTLYEVGLSDDIESGELVEPMPLVTSQTATPVTIVELLLNHLTLEDYERAYDYIAAVGTNNVYKPDLDDFVNQLSHLCKITEYDMQGYVQNPNGEAIVRLRLVIEREEGIPEIIYNCELVLLEESGIYLVDYITFLDVLRK